MATATQTSIRFTDEDLVMLDAIQAHGGHLGRSDAVRFAIRECIRSLGLEVKRPKPAKK